MQIIGLTGGIASGKSTVAKLLQKRYNYQVIDADVLARQAVEKGSKGLEKIVETFGQAILTKEGDLNRKALGKQIAENEGDREKLNKIVHPEVKRLYDLELEKYRQMNTPCLFYDCPLLFEAGIQTHLDETFLVVADEALRRQRIVDRDGVSEELAQKKIDMQMKDSEKEKLADVIIDNNGSKEDLMVTLDCYLSKRKLWVKK